jgi:leader peptidase (prepilin peptidase)/N-methyltransferase
MLVLAVIDYDHQILPDVITLPGIVCGLAASFLPGFPGPLPALLAAVAGYWGMAAVGEGWRLLRGQSGFGQGDWKMTAMLGAFLGWQGMLLTVFLATLAGTLVGVPLTLMRGRNLQEKLPLGTFLGAAGVVAMLFGDAILAWYRGLMQI